jgi:arginase
LPEVVSYDGLFDFMSCTIIPAPSRLGLHASGVEELPMALLHAGLATALDAPVTEPVSPPAWSPDIDPSGVLNGERIAAYSVALADVVADVQGRDRFPVVLGGDCSILLGCLAGARRRGRVGLLFLDGHADFYQPEAEPTGEAASMELGFATGRGPRLLTDIDGPGPLVHDSDVVVVGHRDHAVAAGDGSRPLPSSITAFDLDAVRSLGAAGTVRRAVGEPTRPFWIHLDVDVLDDRLMPAVDYRVPDGLSWEELEIILGSALKSGQAVGLDVTIMNPRLDPDRSLTRELRDFLARTLVGM